MADSDPITKKDLEEIKMLVKQVQNVLVEHLLTQSRTSAARMQGMEAYNAALVERLNTLEERIFNLEMRPTPRPH